MNGVRSKSCLLSINSCLCDQPWRRLHRDTFVALGQNIDQKCCTAFSWLRDIFTNRHFSERRFPTVQIVYSRQKLQITKVDFGSRCRRKATLHVLLKVFRLKSIIGLIFLREFGDMDSLIPSLF